MVLAERSLAFVATLWTDSLSSCCACVVFLLQIDNRDCNLLVDSQTKSAFAGSSSCRAVANLKPGHFSGELQFFFRNLFRQSLFGCECLYIVPVCLWNLQSGLPLRLRIRAGFVSSEISFANLFCVFINFLAENNGCFHTFCHQ